MVIEDKTGEKELKFVKSHHPTDSPSYILPTTYGVQVVSISLGREDPLICIQ